MKKILSLALVLVLLLSVSTGVLAAEDRIEPKELYYRGISIYVNGAELIPRDINGNPTEPFIIEGTTYLPVRALCGALGLDVDWDGQTNTVTLTSGDEVVMGSGQAAKTNKIVSADVYYKDVKIVLDGSELYPTDINGKYVEPFLMGGSTYLPVRAVANALGLKVEWDETSNTVTLTEPQPIYALASMSVKTYSKSSSLPYNEEYLSFEYNAQGKVTGGSFTYYGNPHSFDCSYHPGGQVSRLDVSDSCGDVYSTEREYDEAGNLAVFALSFNGEAERTERYSYDDRGNVIVHELQDGEDLYITYFSYDAQGNLLSSVCGDESTNYIYDGKGNCITELYISGDYSCTYNYEYNSGGQLIREDSLDSDGDSAYTVREYNSAELLSLQRRVWNGNIYENRYSYDSEGRLIAYNYSETVNDTVFTTSVVNEYDSQGRLIRTYTSSSSGNSREECFSFAPDGSYEIHTVTTGDGSSSVTTTEFNSAGLPVKISTDDGSDLIVTEFVYVQTQTRPDYLSIDNALNDLGYYLLNIFPYERLM